MTPPDSARFPPRFAAACARLLTIEGGYVNNSHDSGGATKYGLSLRFLVAERRIDPHAFAGLDLDMAHDLGPEDVRALGEGDAEAIYYRCFWVPLAADSFARPVGEMLFDEGVNGGMAAARKLLQRAVNTALARAPGAGGRPAPLAIDGAIGATTRAALDWVIGWPPLGMVAIIAGFREAAATRYREIVRACPSQAEFLPGWLARAARLGGPL